MSARTETDRPIGTRCRPDCRDPKGTQAHCSVCHQTMTGVTFFDQHRRDGRCVDLTLLGLVNVDGLWSTPEGHESRAVAGARLLAMRGAA